MAKYAIGVITLLATVLVGLVAISGQEDRRILSYKMECNHFQGERSKSICRQFEREMEWTWFGHAILSPGWRVTWETVRRVWCHARITDNDVPALQDLAKSPDWRLEGAADDLLKLLRDDQPENSILNPRNPDYILRQGCSERDKSDGAHRGLFRPGPILMAGEHRSLRQFRIETRESNGVNRKADRLTLPATRSAG